MSTVATTSQEAAFAPPEQQDAGAANLTVVIASWAMAFASLGTAIGVGMEITGVLQSSASVGLGAAGAGAVLGVLSWMLDRRWAQGRTRVLDGKGRLIRPSSVLLLATPLVVGGVGMTALIVVGSLKTGNLALGSMAFAIVGGLVWLTRPLLSSHRIGAAVALAESGDSQGAREGFLVVAGGWWSTRSGRAQAQLNLGLLALRDGDMTMALRWYTLPDRGKAGAFAASGLALLHVAAGRWGEAQAQMQRATRQGGLAVQSEVQGVRLLMVLRQDGPVDAVDLGERLLDQASGALFRGVLAVARAGSGDHEGARALLQPDVRSALQASGLERVLPEVKEVR